MQWIFNYNTFATNGNQLQLHSSNDLRNLQQCLEK